MNFIHMHASEKTFNANACLLELFSSMVSKPISLNVITFTHDQKESERIGGASKPRSLDLKPHNMQKQVSILDFLLLVLFKFVQSSADTSLANIEC